MLLSYLLKLKLEKLRTLQGLKLILQPVYLAKQGELFNLEINVEDIDSSEIQFRLIAPSWEQDPWLELESYDVSGFVTLRGIPRDKSKW